MKTWCRAGVDTLCGSCGDIVHINDPVLEIEFSYSGGARIKKHRCRKCAGEPVPDVPPRVERQSTIAPMVLVSRMATTPLLAKLFDPKRLAANDRDPGEDDE